MTSMHGDPKSGPPRITRAGLRLGVKAALPLMAGVVVFGLAFGASAAQKGLTLVETVLMSAVVYGGIVQFVILEVWAQPMTPTTIAALSLVTGIVNLRYILMGAALRPWLGALPSWQVYPPLYTMTDSSWLLAMRHRAEGGSDLGVLVGAGLAFWVIWIGTAPVGYLLGALMTNPQRFGLDLIMPTFFAAMLVPLWRGRRRAIPWTVAGAVALLVQHLVAGWWFLAAGALAGCIAGGFVDDE